ncbi:MAG: acetolactate synthase small subunit [Omnitrophica bacterium RIFCSPLOWO2_12_FULL_44_17]|uniref:acetolactate synthase n=1 Tax=Candidatus Danuiimicrobium aquiferis TaxID=1801832 RepID=A0A1G1L1W9_9BACT|nr:MAG: acetolactate synthase small subunit [Omnitrophica bacterium RIFCSPHIGHO2_02_FULL_45_28]OGW92484.1 MAG: acetolactate synthase small subunit [Omnitrophica bacterium RIFCSPHIGHO2_12_FULL_44_12]OGW99150.1 MAG: acetolactate synthase small subunit [Omnitrophica bacterium RIFCSPLOWO2_12_FULL_44_17]
MKKHTISVLVENHPGVLARVAGLFSARGFNIDSLAVGETHDPEVSRMTISVTGDEKVLEQIMKQLDKLIDVITVVDISKGNPIERELVLIKVSANPQNRNDIMQIVNTFRAKVVDVSPDSLTVEVTGTESKIDAMLELLRPFELREVVRTGLIALARRTELAPPPKHADELNAKKLKGKQISSAKKHGGSAMLCVGKKSKGKSKKSK